MSGLPKKLDEEIRNEAKNRCGYCLGEQKYILAWLEIEHIFPHSKGGKSVKENLCLACRLCNLYKSAKIYGFDAVSAKHTRLFNPNLQIWSEHFIWDKMKTSIIGKTPCGRATVYALKMNDDLQTNAHTVWRLTKLFPPKD